MHGGDAETFMVTTVFDILDKVSNWSGKVLAFRSWEELFPKDSIFWSAEPDCLYIYIIYIDI
jgi:hypothetical protein